jgi:uncharacterized membrane protein
VNNWNVIFATAIIFGAGVLTGGLLVNYVKHSESENSARAESTAIVTNSISATNNSLPIIARAARLPEMLSKQFLQRLDAELHFTLDQREAVQKIITEGQNQMRKTMQDARLEIREQLTPDQRKQFDELVKRPRRPNATNASAIFSGTNFAATNAP